MDYTSFFAGKKITVMGLGLLGRGIGDVKFLAECGADLLVTDIKTEKELQSSVDQLRHFSNIRFVLGGHRFEDFKGRDFIVKNPDVKPGNVYIEEARKNGIPIKMSASWMVELSGIQSIGVTGTRGKSTVTHLINHVLKEAGYKTILGGNVRGVSSLALLNEIEEESVAVLELDSWQLQGFGESNVSPHIAVFTNLMQDHLNYYGGDPTRDETMKAGMQKYFDDKANIFRNQKEGDVLIVGKKVFEEWISAAHPQVTPIVPPLLPPDWKLNLLGEHNRENAALARAALQAFGIPDEKIRAGFEGFEAVDGRLQFVREVQGVKIYNDNNATTPDATVAALRALDEGKKNIILLVGGTDKGIDPTALAEMASDACKALVSLAGSGTDKLVAALEVSATELLYAGPYPSLAQALEEVWKHAAPGDIILFSPGFASFGMFQNEYDRNDQFVNLVQQL